MRERLGRIWGRIRDFFKNLKNLKKGVKIGLVAGFVAVIVLAAFLAIHTATRPYAVLYTGLTPEDVSTVVTYLNNAGVTDVKVIGTDTIQVRADQADRLRALVAQQGYPTSGFSHDTYLNNRGSLDSQADREQLWLLDLQDSLAATIQWFDGVENARVWITPGESSRYILDESVTEATASVVVQMRTGKTLTNDQVAAIQRFVANSEKGLSFSNVTVEDGAGHRYTIDNASTADVLDDTMKYKLALESQLNEQTRNSVMNVLVPYFGVGNVEVSVHSTVDISSSTTQSLIYHEPDWVVIDQEGGHGIIGSRIWDNSQSRLGDEAAGGVVGTTTNTEINEYVTIDDQLRGDETDIRRSGEDRYLVSQDNTQTENPPGTVKDMTLTIAVNSAKFNVQDTSVFIHAAAMAAGIDSEVEAQKIAIVSYPFYESNQGSGSTPTPVEQITMIFGLPAWAIYAAIAGVALFLALLLVILLLRSKKKKKIAILLAQEEAAAAEAAAAEAAALAAAQQGADIMDVHTEETMKMRQDVRQFVEENPAIAAQMIKNWLRGGEEM